MVTRRNYQEAINGPVCDLCADRAPDSWWECSTVGDLVVPDSSLDPKTGQWINTRFPAERSWGICGLCKTDVGPMGDLNRIIARFRRVHPEAQGPALVALAHIVVFFACADRTPFERMERPEPGVVRRWVEELRPGETL